MLLPLQGANGGVASYPGCRSLWSLALGWEVLPFQGVNGGVEFHLLLNYNPCRYTRYAGESYPRITGISRKYLC
jgi:hypothetical protein